MKSITIFLDTNVFIHYRSIEDIDWPKVVGTTEIKIVLVPVNFRELNKLKDDHQTVSKTRQRASSSLKLLRRLLDEDRSTKLPATVKILFDSQNPPQDMFDSHYLVTYIPDDHFLASILHYQKRFESEQVIFITHDVGAQKQSEPLGIKTMELPVVYKIPDEPDEQQLEIRKLQEELQRFKSRLPNLKVRFNNGSHELNTPIEDDTDEELLERQMRVVKEKHPYLYPEKTVDFALLPNMKISALFGLTSIPEHEYDRYNRELETFYEQYEAYVIKLKRFSYTQQTTVKVQLELVNIGTAPATDIDIYLSFQSNAVVKIGDEEYGKPREPKAPSKPRSMMDIQTRITTELLPDYLNLTDHLNDAQLFDNFSTPQIKSTDTGTQIHFHVSKLKHNCSELMHCFFLDFDDVEDMKTFCIQYRISAHEMIDDASRQLIVKFDRS